ncbi:hypothetical protein [Saccharothrix xinjiangensis]|uniref:Zinc-binding dehydrogenase n=1 Tax=Saccharothrix xinjiangensis TaxID=204798 RepID=A0ABV9Y171_9PSEU
MARAVGVTERGGPEVPAVVDREVREPRGGGDAADERAHRRARPRPARPAAGRRAGGEGLLASAGGLQLRVAGEYPPEEAAEAYRVMDAGGLRGRVVIRF